MPLPTSEKPTLHILTPDFSRGRNRLLLPRVGDLVAYVPSPTLADLWVILEVLEEEGFMIENCFGLRRRIPPEPARTIFRRV